MPYSAAPTSWNCTSAALGASGAAAPSCAVRGRFAAGSSSEGPHSSKRGSAASRSSAQESSMRPSVQLVAIGQESFGEASVARLRGALQVCPAEVWPLGHQC